MKLNKYIDHTLLKSFAKHEEIKKLCDEAVEYEFFSVCINPCYVKYAKKMLAGTDIKVCTVIGFPLGSSTTEIKVLEAIDAVQNGADEIDMVINVGFVKTGKYEEVFEEIEKIKSAIGDKILKVIIETCYLSDTEKRKIAEICINANADFIKTSTGFGTGGATVEDVVLIKDIIGDRAKIKASGGIKNYKDALKFINAGADRLGTSSGVKITSDEKEDIKVEDY